jgi:Asp-tRNA(Asn)/Glu-tRNA(Gln) amidotransferase A subunit family amidase
MTDPHRDYPRLFPRPEQTIAGIGRAIREGRVSCIDVLNRCFEQIDEWEPKVHAWVVLDRDGAIEQALAMDEELKAGNDRGPLHGIPIGIKDLFDVKGLPTACGAKRWLDRIADQDAEAVARLRTAGAVIMGKTVTTAYACLDPPVTRNPWNLDRTPGGSSSGSAAAVACGMCYGAPGTQTGGSITRPASFCGVAGMKPTHGFVSTAGVLPFAPSFDHVGPIARTVEDLRLIFSVMCESSQSLLKKQQASDSPRRSPPRLGRLRGFFDRRAEPSMRLALDDAVRALESGGAEVVDVEDPLDFEQVLTDHRQVLSAEAANVHSDWLDEFPDDYPPQIRQVILEGREITALAYLRARYRGHERLLPVMKSLVGAGNDALITPATIGTPPDPSTTGDPAFNAPWSLLMTPTVSLPIGRAPDGLPLAIQLVGRIFHDLELLRTAEWCEQVIRTWRQ